MMRSILTCETFFHVSKRMLKGLSTNVLLENYETCIECKSLVEQNELLISSKQMLGRITNCFYEQWACVA